MAWGNIKAVGLLISKEQLVEDMMSRRTL